MPWWNRIFYRYRLLLILAFAVCLLQILVGISFLSSRHDQNEANNPSSRSESVVNDPPSNHEPLHSNSSQSDREQLQLSQANLGVNIHCNVSGKEALSALTRAVTKQCKQQIVDLVCNLQAGNVYPASLQSSCPMKVDASSGGIALGCYQDSFSARLLQGHVAKLRSSNSPTVCSELCAKTGFAYAGVQYGAECFCGNGAVDTDKKLPDAKCGMPCSGRQDLTCGGYLTMQVYTTGSKPLKPEKTVAVLAGDNPPARIVFLLSVSGRAVRQVHRLVNSLYSPHHYFLIHVDRRQDYLYREMEALAARMPNVRLVTRRFATIWGGASLLQMLLTAMEELLAMQDWTWDFVLNLSESDYPIKPRDELVNFLTANKHNNFVKSHGREPERFIKKQGLDKTFFECDTHMWRIGGRTLPWGVQIDGGSDWICLNNKFVKYVVHSNDDLVTGLKKVFEHTLLPAESFFHTVLRNSEFCGSYVDNNLHLTNWKRKLGCKCQYRAIVDWCGCSPNDFLPEDWPRLEATSPKQLFFARKFEPIINQDVLNMVDNWVSSKSSSISPETGENASPETGDNVYQYWQNFYHHMDASPSPDPPLVIAIKTLAQIYLKRISASCGQELSFVKVTEMTTYNYRDSYNASLILLEALYSDSGYQKHLELEMKVLRNAKLDLKLGTTLPRTLGMEVSSVFDPKELVLRNTFGTLGPSSQPMLRLTFGEGKTNIAKFGWVDPTGVLAAVNTIQLNDTAGTEGLKPDLKSQLRGGVWRVLAVLDDVFVAKLEFLVIPDVQPSIGPIPSTHPVTDAILSKYVQKDSEKLLKESNSNEEKTGENRQQWIQFLLDSFYDMEGWCSVDGDCGRDCKETHWSSEYPDKKSTILI